MAGEREVTPRPFWWPEARGFVAIGVFLLALLVIVLSARYPELMKEQLWVQIVTALVLTALIGLVLNFWFGTSKGSADKSLMLDKKKDDAE